MESIRAIWRSNQIIPIDSVDWPDGTPLRVTPCSAADMDSDILGDDPASIARWLAWFDALPVPEMSETELEDLDAARRAMRQSQSATAEPPSSQLKPFWERVAELRANHPEVDWSALPADGAEQLDHYIYGTPKRSEDE
jgi:hypothetical protein